MNRKLVAAVDQRPDTRVLVVDTTALGMITLTVVDEVAELEHDLAERGVSLWIAALPPAALATARQTPRWGSLVEAGRLHPTALAAVRAFRSR